MAACVAVALQRHHRRALPGRAGAVGVGWNFMYTGGTTLLTEAYAPAEKARTQGANDFIVFATMGVSSFSSGALVSPPAGSDESRRAAVPRVIAARRCGSLGARRRLGRSPDASPRLYPRSLRRRTSREHARRRAAPGSGQRISQHRRERVDRRHRPGQSPACVRRAPRSSDAAAAMPCVRMPPPTRNIAAVPATDSAFIS